MGVVVLQVGFFLFYVEQQLWIEYEYIVSAHDIQVCDLKSDLSLLSTWSQPMVCSKWPEF